ncbi:ankyrin repeat protein [Catovirus CTV1]|uniref:Ankyrin repeat protein n=1 Tax=Catovirus CTV1 TaxID=1977631 RepID=A0A1V0SAB6_9VIRU|nr:ankyrin repeat protein [Catovirus CTV1]
MNKNIGTLMQNNDFTKNMNNIIIQNDKVNRKNLRYLSSCTIDVFDLLLTENYDDIFHLIFSGINVNINLTDESFKKLVIKNNKLHRINLDYVKYIKKNNKIDCLLDISELILAGNIDDVNYLKSLNIKLNEQLDLNDNTIFKLCDENKLEVLFYLKNNNIQFKYPNNVIELASIIGSVKLLDFWKNSGLSSDYTNISMDQASVNGFIDVLEWWKKSELPLKYTNYAMNQASENGLINILDWWKNSELPLKYSRNALSWSYHIDVLNWWLISGLNINFNLNRRIKKKVERETNMDIRKWWDNYQQNIICVST